MAFIQHGIVKQNISVLGHLQQWLHVFPQQTGCQFLATQVPIDPVMADTLEMVSLVRYSVVDGTAQGILAVVEFSEAHSFSLTASSLSFLLPLCKSC